jgi:hypothetical protein
MAEKLCQLKKKGGGKKSAIETYSVSGIALNTNYTYVATGTFLYAKTYRNASVSTAPSIRFYIKEGSNYTPISDSVSVTNQTNTYVGANQFIEGEIYFNKPAGTNVNINLDVYYLSE